MARPSASGLQASSSVSPRTIGLCGSHSVLQACWVACHRVLQACDSVSHAGHSVLQACCRPVC